MAAAIGIIATAVMEAGVAVGGAVSTGLAAVGGVSGLATGLSIASTAVNIVGKVSGSKTLQKIGGYGMMAGGVLSGVGAVGGMMSGAAGASTVGGGVLQASSIGNMVKSDRAKAAGLKTMDATDEVGSIGSFQKASDALDYKSSTAASAVNEMSKFDPQLEKSYWDRANATLTQYNPLMNMLGGMGEAYMQNAAMENRMKIHKDEFGLQKQQYDDLMANRNAPLNLNPVSNFSRNTQAYSGILGR